MYLGSFYRPPNRKPEIEKEYLEAFNHSLTMIMSNKNAHVLVGGDFNCWNIEWSTMQVPEGGTEETSSESTFGNRARSLPVPSS